MRDPRGVGAGDAGLAVILALVPLLPYGPRYLGFPPASYVELAVVALVLLWAVTRWRRRRKGAEPGSGGDATAVRTAGEGTRAVRLAWGGFLVVVVGAAWVGLVAENHLSSPVFLAHLSEAPWKLFVPADMATYPLHPLRVVLTLAEGFLVFVIVGDLCRRAPSPRRRARVALAGWMGGLAVVSVVALVQHQGELGLHPYWIRVNPDLVRAHSTFDDPNALGSFLVVGMGLVAAALVAARDRRRRVLLGLLTVVVAGALWTTKSRAAWGGLLLGVTLVLGALPPRWLPGPLRDARRIRLAARAVLVVFVLAVAVSGLLRPWGGQGFQERRPASTLEVIGDTLDPQQPLYSVLKGRTGWWRAAAEMVEDHPRTGVGLGRFPRLAPRYGGPAGVRENAHNLYLQLAAEAGLVGIAAFLVLLGTSFWVLGRAMRSPPARESRLLAAGLLAGGLGFCITMVTGHVLLLPSGQLVWAGALALVLALVEVESGTGGPAIAGPGREARRERPGMSGAKVGTAVAAAAILLLYGLVGDPPFAMTRQPPWGYDWGLYPTEQDGSGRTFRWTGERALLDLELPPGARRLELPIAAPNVVREGRRTVVRVRVDGMEHAVSPGASAMEIVGFPLTVGGDREGRGVLVEIEVSPTYVPADVGASDDTRRLGVQLFEPRIETGPVSR